MRNIQNKLILYWTPKNIISEIISVLPTFCDNFEFQIKEGIFPNIGLYHINSYKYDINDFMGNINNICFKVKIPYEKNNALFFKDNYLLITTSTIIILEPVDVKFRNICLIKYAGDLFGIEKLEKIENFGNFQKIVGFEKIEEFFCFKIIWNNNITQGFNDIFCLEKEGKSKTDIVDIISVRKDIIKNNFQFFEKSENLDVDDYKFIIDIKKKMIQKEANEIIYDEINKCYRKIIEILSNLEDDNIQKYIEELHKFIEDYEKKYLNLK